MGNKEAVIYDLELLPGQEHSKEVGQAKMNTERSSASELSA